MRLVRGVDGELSGEVEFERWLLRQLSLHSVDVGALHLAMANR